MGRLTGFHISSHIHIPIQQLMAVSAWGTLCNLIRGLNEARKSNQGGDCTGTTSLVFIT